MQKKEGRIRNNTAGNILPFSCWDCMRYFVVPALFVATVAIILALFATDYINGDNMLYAALDRLIHNVTVQFGLLHEKTFSLMNKDMDLMDNVTSLDERIDLLSVNSSDQIVALIAKDMVLMGNVSSLDARIIQEEIARIAKDMELMDNVTSLDARILLEQAARIAKDMELMGNVTDLRLLLDMLANITDANTTTKITDLMMMIMTLESESFTHIEDGYGTDLSVSPTATPSGVGRTLRVDLNVAGSPTISITPGPSPAGTVTWDTNAAGLITQLNAAPTMGPTWAVNICGAPTCGKISQLAGTIGPTTTGSIVNIFGGTHATTTSSPTTVTIDVDAASVCATCPSGGGGGGILNITGSSGGSTTGSTVTLAQGTGITTVRSGDTITIANTGVTTLIPTNGFPTSTNAVNIAQGAGISIVGSGGNTITIGADLVNSPTVSFTPTPTPTGIGITASLDFQVFSGGNTHHWCSIFVDDGGGSDWDMRLNVRVRYWRIGKAIQMQFHREGAGDNTFGPGGYGGGIIGSAPPIGTKFILCEGTRSLVPVGPFGLGSACDMVGGCTCTRTGVTIGAPGGPWMPTCTPALTGIPAAAPDVFSNPDMLIIPFTADLSGVPTVPIHATPTILFLDIRNLGVAFPIAGTEVAAYNSIIFGTGVGLAHGGSVSISYYTP